MSCIRPREIFPHRVLPSIQCAPRDPHGFVELPQFTQRANPLGSHITPSRVVLVLQAVHQALGSLGRLCEVALATEDLAADEFLPLDLQPLHHRGQRGVPRLEAPHQTQGLVKMGWILLEWNGLGSQSQSRAEHTV
ncbi:hypothetical protein N7492_007627 [Penicillium capsulatum]|uniref:Uncharacterized protein n=1 Tax=Penicillium capsulatum TaxID=69766 RepID=A0A9W9I5H1_9EURO|nr:hypothetical protein N7492_007627 [Penicillium capsulatum]KAJ6117461.1 hypothetical protein N7512_007186 [Penicillium capsulatum]